ncbi:universal stress protein [Trebonia sp.]|uniref:universal stress protein n=1 Tax=Trebonia sp. TaxID=2767075 RepID=UPI002630DC7F|nr:universal stress protein [Trebonia sp.]
MPGILAGIDGSHDSGRARDWALREAAPRQTPIKVLSAHPVMAGAEMIVIGSRGVGGFERLTMGSVGDQVARHAHCPVVIIPRERQAQRAQTTVRSG